MKRKNYILGAGLAVLALMGFDGPKGPSGPTEVSTGPGPAPGGPIKRDSPLDGAAQNPLQTAPITSNGAAPPVDYPIPVSPPVVSYPNPSSPSEEYTNAADQWEYESIRALQAAYLAHGINSMDYSQTYGPNYEAAIADWNEWKKNNPRPIDPIFLGR